MSLPGGLSGPGSLVTNSQPQNSQTQTSTDQQRTAALPDGLSGPKVTATATPTSPLAGAQPATTQGGIQSTGLTAPTGGMQTPQVQSATIQTGTQYGEIPNPAAQQQAQQQGDPYVQMSMQTSGNPVQDAMDTPIPWGMYGETPQEMLDFFSNFGPGGEGIPGALGMMLTQFTDLYKGLENQWNADMGMTPEASPYMANLLQNFQYNPGSLTGDVAQNWTNAMDAGAWEQRANNLMAAQRENLLGGLNEAERRARGAAARGGYSPAAGLGNAYNNYSQGLTQATRDIYNDSLQQQMNALQGASSYALGSEAQDRALYNQALGMMNQAGMYDAMNRADQHTNFGEFAGGVLGAGAAALGGMNDFAGNLLGGLGGGAGGSLAGLLPLLAGGPPLPI